MDPDLTSDRGVIVEKAKRRAQFEFPALAEDVHFSETTFPAMLKPSGVRFNNHGDVEVLLVIPARYREQIVPLGYAMRSPLLVHIERWRNLDLENESENGDG